MVIFDVFFASCVRIMCVGLGGLSAYPPRISIRRAMIFFLDSEACGD